MLSVVSLVASYKMFVKRTVVNLKITQRLLKDRSVCEESLKDMEDSVFQPSLEEITNQSFKVLLNDLYLSGK